jgi:hypothetical protein
MTNPGLGLTCASSACVRRACAVNATLPAMAGQFLLLMVALDKLWFTPVGKVLDERDALIRSKLANVSDNTGDVDKYAQEAQEILKVRYPGAICHVQNS